MIIEQKRRPGPAAGVMLVAASLVLAPTIATSADRAARIQARAVPDSIMELKLSTPESTTVGSLSALEPSLRNAQGRQQVIVRLKERPVAQRSRYAADQRAAKSEIMAKQQAFISRCNSIDPSTRVLAQTQVVLNAVFLEADASALAEIAADPEVERVAPVRNYEMHLSETVPYIGGTEVQARGFDGSGISIAILDSGIDYTHAAFGGPGTLAAYEAAYGTDPTDPLNTTTDGLFPTAKVVGGFDFVGEAWDASATSPPLIPDPDPIGAPDATTPGGHGTHVADIAGGLGGVAPGAHLYAVKVCAAVSSACSGVALIQGMDFATDPNGDGDTSDAVDVINMSLGAVYGQPFDDDLSLAVDNATALGVLTVASAGNSSDKPYITGAPAAAPTALSVAQTQVPSAALQLITVDSVDFPAVFQSWSAPLVSTVSGPVQYGDDDGTNLDGCGAFTGDLTGKIVLVDRGACFFTTKIFNIGNAGGSAGIIGLVAPGAPFSGGFADPGGPITIPGYMISQADSNAIKSAISAGGGEGEIDPGNQLPLVMQMVGSSSRGPSNNFNAIKPEIGAPGASVSAASGSGEGANAFGGTSGAAPMVAGSAALLLEARPSLSPAEVKAVLMNNGETDIDTDPFQGLAPITRIGGGEVRVDHALRSPVAAWDDKALTGSLNFGFVDVANDRFTMTKVVRLQNYSGRTQRYEIAPTFRFQDDADNGAVSVEVSPSRVLIPRHSHRKVVVKMTIDGALLRGNFMNSGSEGANPVALTTNEYDGYLQFVSDQAPAFQMAWQVLPRKAARVMPERPLAAPGGDSIQLHNTGVGTAQIDAYALLAESEDLPEGGRGEQAPVPDIRAFGVNTFPVAAGFCSAEASFIWAFAINTHERQTHLLPVSHQVSLDTNQDGTTDFVVLNRDLSGPNTFSDGRQLSWVFDVNAGTLSAFFFAEHSTNTGNTVLYICGEQVGLTGTDLLSTNVDVNVLAQDFYFGGPGDAVGPFTLTPLGERFVGATSDIPGNASAPIDITDFGPFPGNTPEVGLLLITNGDRGAGARGGATQKTEAVILRRAAGPK